MHANETMLQRLIEGTRQFQVPLFQRPYTWDQDDHKVLWRDILDQYDRTEIDEATGQELSPATTHFLGSFVLAPITAMRDAASLKDGFQRDRFNERYVINKWESGADKYRLLPTRAGRKAFFCTARFRISPSNETNRMLSKTFRLKKNMLDARCPVID